MREKSTLFGSKSLKVKHFRKTQGECERNLKVDAIGEQKRIAAIFLAKLMERTCMLKQNIIKSSPPLQEGGDPYSHCSWRSGKGTRIHSTQSDFRSKFSSNERIEAGADKHFTVDPIAVPVCKCSSIRTADSNQEFVKYAHLVGKIQELEKDIEFLRRFITCNANEWQANSDETIQSKRTTSSENNFEYTSSEINSCPQKNAEYRHRAGKKGMTTKDVQASESILKVENLSHNGSSKEIVEDSSDKMQPKSSAVRQNSSWNEEESAGEEDAFKKSSSKFEGSKNDLRNETPKSANHESQNAVNSSRFTFTENLTEAIENCVNQEPHHKFMLSICPEKYLNKTIYCVNILQRKTGFLAGCLFITERTLNEARVQGIFDNYMSLFVLNSFTSYRQFRKFLQKDKMEKK